MAKLFKENATEISEEEEIIDVSAEEIEKEDWKMKGKKFLKSKKAKVGLGIASGIAIIGGIALAMTKKNTDPESSEEDETESMTELDDLEVEMEE